MTSVLQGDALHIPLGDETVDLIITSPPYFALRSYRDGGEHYDGQIGSEPTPQAFLEALWAVTKECWRVLKPGGSMFVNLGDKRSGSGGHNNAGIVRQNSARWCETCQASVARMRCPGCGGTNLRVSSGPAATRRNAPDRYNQAAFGRSKSKMLLPHRYAIGCEDGLADPDGVGWIVRQDIVWDKPNGLPESVTDRVRDSHEYWFHLTKQGDYFAAVDEVREAHLGVDNAKSARGPSGMNRGVMTGMRSEPVGNFARDPLGKLPGSVWKIASEPLAVPDYMVEDHTGWRLWDAPAIWQHARLRFEAGDMRPLLVRDIDHFAAFPQEWPRRLILGWSPSGICTACGEGRRPVVDRKPMEWRESPTMEGRRDGRSLKPCSGTMLAPAESTITGYACACPDTSAPTRPAVVLDCFGGTGTVAMVARALGRTGISLDLSADYTRLARWRIFHSGHASKTRERTNRAAQGSLL